MKSNFAALMVLFITGCGSDAMDSTSMKVDETGGEAGASTTEIGGDASTSVGGSSAVTPGGSSSTTTTTTTVAGSPSTTTTTAATGGSSNTTATTTTVAGSGQGGQGTQASGGSSPASGGSAVQTSGGSSPQATGGSAPATGGKAGASSGGTSATGGRTNTATGGRTTGTGGATSTGAACNPNAPVSVCGAFQVCDMTTRHCVGPVRNTAVDCSSVAIDGWKTFGYSSSTAPNTAFDTRARCQAAPTASTDPSVQNYCCNFNKDSCMVSWADFPPACPTTGATAGKPYLYDCLKGITPPVGYSVAVVNTEYAPVGVGYCYATQTVE